MSSIDKPPTDPTADPTADPTGDPTADPTGDPTADPTCDPSAAPIRDPSPAAEGQDESVAVMPVLDVEPGHIAEARRALAAQGRTVGEEAAVRLLWSARALPAALDALVNHRLHLPLERVVFSGIRLDFMPPESPARADLLFAVAHVTDYDTVVVEIFERRALLASTDDTAVPRCSVELSFLIRPEEGEEVENSVSVRRFTHGPPV